jgi:molybdopterin/thiamine biosynthesis adenylyltransferase
MSLANHQEGLPPYVFRGPFDYWEAAFARNRGLFSLADQERLMNATVAIPGLGGVGGLHLVTLARAGVGGFHLADMDRFEPANLNRQYGAKMSHFGRTKVEVMVAEALDINPYLEIRSFPEGVREDNLDAFLEGVDVVADGMDFFNFDMRRLIFRRAREKGIHVVTAGPLGYSAALLVFAPERGMGFDDYFDIREGMDPEEKLMAFFLGLAPRATQMAYMDPRRIDLRGQQGPSLAVGCQMCAAVAATEIQRILLGRPGIKPVPHYCQYDPLVRQFHRGYLPLGNRHPIQRLKRRLLARRLSQAREALRPACPDPPPVAPIAGAIPEAISDYLVAAGIQAPSGDNCQPWKFRRLERGLELYLDPAADGSFFNVAQMASVIACGAALENVLVAATRYGLEGRVEAFPDPERPTLAARITLTCTGTVEDPRQRFIWERHTNRTPYDGRPLATRDEEALRAAAGGVPGVRLELLTDRTRIKTAAVLVGQADRIRVEHRALHEHLQQMIRYTAAEARGKGDGFPLGNLEAGAAGEWFLRATRSWSVMRVLNALGIGRLVPMIARQGVKSASAVGLIAVDNLSPEAFLAGGRVLERVWLTAARQGLDFQPMTAITLFRLRGQLEGAGGFQARHRRLLEDLWPRYEALWGGVRASAGEGHVMLFRLGHGRPVSCRTLRKASETSALEGR